MNRWFIKNKIYLFFILYSLINVIFLRQILFHHGFPFKYDWAWPIFDLRQFWDSLIGGNSFGLFSTLSKNAPVIFGLFGLVNFPPALFLKLFIFLVHFTAGYSFYRFVRIRVRSQAIAVISGLAYAFTSYIFIRTIVGFTWSLVAYAVLPIFLSKYWQTKKGVLDYLMIGFLFSLIFGQSQAGILTSLIITVYLIVVIIDRLPRQPKNTGLARNDSTGLRASAKNYLYTFLSLFAVSLPWMIAMLVGKQSLAVVSGGAVTTLNFIASLPHSFRSMFMLSDHHITAGYFYPLSHNRYYLLGWLIVWLISLCAIFNKKNRQIVLTFIISSLLVLPFIKGPTGIFGNFYIWFYSHVPQIAVFRETYHFEFLFAISLCILFALGLDWLWQKIDNLKSQVPSPKSQVLVNSSLKAILAASAVVIVWPYLTFNYAGYLKLQQIPPAYNDLYNYFQQNKTVCHKIYYPPGLGFVYFKDDNSPGASNSDLIASSLGVPYLTDGASVLNLPSDEMFYRNEVVSQFYERQDSGQFAGLLREGSIDCVVVRTDLDTKYKDASNLGRETDPTIISKWNNTDILGLTRSKSGLKLEEQFGENIYIYKSTGSQESGVGSLEFALKKEQDVDLSFPQTPNPKPQTTLPLTEWATESAYYKDGWSRGRYDFWRKHLFTQLRQDFIYTDKQGSVLSGKIAQSGSYDLWVRYLTGGSIGTWDLGLGDSKFQIQKDQGEEKFTWKKLGVVDVKKSDIVTIRNISGENAIADLILIKTN